MSEDESILKSVRSTVVGTPDNADFDRELLNHINSSIAKLNQNGIGNFIIVKGEDETWGDLKDPLQLEGNKYFKMVPLYISLSTQLLFDPPPPSNVQYHSDSSKELLWRLKIAYEV